MLAMLLALGLAGCSRDAAGMESSAELQLLRTLPVRPVQSVQSLETLPGVAIESYAPTLADKWRSKRRKVKRRQRLNSQSNLPTITANAGMGTNLSSWQQQRYLKVNQVFESERRMSHAEIQRNHGKIVLLGLFELSTKRGPRPDGLSELGAATMAVEHINRKQLLPGYTLELVTNDTQVSPPQ